MSTKSVAFPEDLNAIITRKASEEHRSFSGQVVHMLDDYLKHQFDVERRLDELEAAILKLASRLD